MDRKDHDTASARLRELQDAHELSLARHAAYQARERAAEQARLALGQEQAAANRAKREEAENLHRLEAELAELRRKRSAGRPGPHEVTDRALVAWLERVEGFDVGEVRERILRAVADATFDGADGALKYYRYRGSRLVVRDGRVVTVLE